uniref:Sugar phosphate transporter domain-containing protein n=1 Tax=Oryza rufipogon TaxID=4529 RepID=A0A0E0QI43_ORYRU
MVMHATSSLVIGHALCSSLLAIINKYAMTKFSYPGLLTALQYLTSVAGLGLLYHDPFNFQTAKKFAPAALVFYLAIFTNTYTSPEASLTPLLVAIADDTAFRIQEAAMSFQAHNFVPCDYFRRSAIESRGQSWFELDAFVTFPCLTVSLSCVFGLLISFFGFAARKAISATAFTVTGVVNKFFSQLQSNVMIWDKHAGSPLPREAVAKQGKADNDADELDKEKQSLVSSPKDSNISNVAAEVAILQDDSMA